MATEDQEPQVDDRRAAIEAAFEASEREEPAIQPVVEKPAVEEPVKEVKTAPVEPITEVQTETAPTEKTEPVVEKPAGEKVLDIEKPPQAWKGAQKAKWAALDPDVRQEVLRREHDVTRVLNDSATARQFVGSFQQVLQPFAQRLQAGNINPLQAIQGLLQADNLLSTAEPKARAGYMAKLIADYKIDVNELDNALAERQLASPVASRVEQIVQERLAPVQQFMAYQHEQQQAQAQQAAQQINQTVETMAADTETYPHFQQVRGTMADIVDFYATKGQNISVAEAYNRAIAMDPVIFAEVQARTAAATAASKAAAQNEQAQRALKASSSVRGAPGGNLSGTPLATDRRATIAAAFEAASGR
jgi:tetratricopeptide (TPR) repeat protein